MFIVDIVVKEAITNLVARKESAMREKTQMDTLPAKSHEKKSLAEEQSNLGNAVIALSQVTTGEVVVF